MSLQIFEYSPVTIANEKRAVAHLARWFAEQSQLSQPYYLLLNWQVPNLPQLDALLLAHEQVFLIEFKHIFQPLKAEEWEAEWKIACTRTNNDWIWKPYNRVLPSKKNPFKQIKHTREQWIRYFQNQLCIPNAHLLYSLLLFVPELHRDSKLPSISGSHADWFWAGSQIRLKDALSQFNNPALASLSAGLIERLENRQLGVYSSEWQALSQHPLALLAFEDPQSQQMLRWEETLFTFEALSFGRNHSRVSIRNTMVSRQHALLKSADSLENIVFCDLESQNGSFWLDGTRILGEVILPPEKVILLGSADPQRAVRMTILPISSNYNEETEKQIGNSQLL